MALTDLFTGAPAIDAARNARALYGNTEDRTFNLANLTRGVTDGYLRQGYGDARTDLAQGYNAGTDAINRGAGNAYQQLDRGTSGALGQLADARNTLTAGGGAYAPLTALAGRYGQGAGLYADALGINGAGGTARAQDAFTAGPGYQFMVDQGLDAINRRRNAAGSLVGGNADRDAQLFGMGTAKQEYGSWLDRLGAFNPLELSATQGAAAGNQANNQAVANLGVTGANILDREGQIKAGIATGQGTSLADLARNYYGGQAGLDTGEATALTGNMNNNTNMLVNSINSNADRTAKTFQDEAQASLTGQKNLVNLGMQGLTMAAGGFGGMNLGGGSFGLPGGNLGLSNLSDPSLWNKSLPANGFNW